jgi:8-oxo-dGTP pyrophosphatase MutT (NUDIX family)
VRTKRDDAVVRAAGGLIVRAAQGGTAEILLVHRPRYDDWTLPKGKAKTGESDEACALREVEEETGLHCVLGAEVAVSEYEDAAGRPKRVRYFSMTPPADLEPTPQNEVDAVRWVALRLAAQTLSYARDVEVLERAASRVD